MSASTDPQPARPGGVASPGEEIFRRLVDSVRDYAIFVLTPEGIIASWNVGAQRLKGYTAEEAIGQHFSIFYPADAAASGWPQEELRRARAEGRFEDEGWRLRKDGSRFWANVVISAIRDEDGGLVGFSKVTRDLTERREHEQRVRESEESLRLVVEGVRDHAMFLLGPDGTVRSWNGGVQRVLGYDSVSLVGQPLDVLYTPEDREAGRPQADLQTARQSGFFGTDGWRVKADGSRLWVHAAVTALHDANGALRGYAHILQDLSERLRVNELETEGRRLQQFIALLSHELRNPLAPISNAVRILKQTTDSPNVVWCADLIGRQTAHLTRLVDDLLDVSRITSGKIRLQTAPVELNTLVTLACDTATPGIRGLGQSLEVRPAPQPVFVNGDTTRLTQVLSNLLSNASRYTPEGGRIRVSVQRDRAAATIEVADSGIGMSARLMERAFDPFVQGRRQLDRSGGGLGIGLTLVRSVVELHGGRVTAASPGSGKGSRFTVTLPLARGVPRESTPAPAPATLQGGSTRILVVDDNEDAALSLAEVLRGMGHEVAVALDGVQALRTAQRQRPQMVLLDLGLPGMDGFEVAQRLRRLRGLAGTRIIALTGYGQESDREATARAGFDSHLVKPVEFEQLQKLIA